MKKIEASALALVTLSLMACSAADPGAGEAATPSASHAALVTRTVVTLTGDGKFATRTEQITRETQLAEIAARGAYVEQLRHPRTGGVGTVSSAISYDGSCAGASLWLFDSENLLGNQICFIGQGDVDLSLYADGDIVCGAPAGPCSIPTWAGSVRSLYAGVDAGYLAACTGTFQAWERKATLSESARSSRYLSLATELCPLH